MLQDYTTLTRCLIFWLFNRHRLSTSNYLISSVIFNGSKVSIFSFKQQDESQGYAVARSAGRYMNW